MRVRGGGVKRLREGGLFCGMGEGGGGMKYRSVSDSEETGSKEMISSSESSESEW